jgi:hypothetical protein
VLGDMDVSAFEYVSVRRCLGILCTSPRLSYDNILVKA